MYRYKVKVKLSGISEMMLRCLWGLARLSKEHSALFYDATAIELNEKIEYDLNSNCFFVLAVTVAVI